jgi:hypothetical protein
MARSIVIGVAVLAALGCLHLLASWAEDQGWIYYRKGRGRSSALSNAMLSVQAAFHPAGEHVIEERRRPRRVDAETGEGGGPDTDDGT